MNGWGLVSSSVEDLVAQLNAIRGELPYTRAVEFDTALEGVSTHVLAVLQTSRHTDDVINQIQAVRAEGSTAIQEHLQFIDTVLGNTATQL